MKMIIEGVIFEGTASEIVWIFEEFKNRRLLTSKSTLPKITFNAEGLPEKKQFNENI